MHAGVLEALNLTTTVTDFPRVPPHWVGAFVSLSCTARLGALSTACSEAERTNVVTAHPAGPDVSYVSSKLQLPIWGQDGTSQLAAGLPPPMCLSFSPFTQISPIYVCGPTDGSPGQIGCNFYSAGVYLNHALAVTATSFVPT